jgi:hypothetical protein
MLFLLTVFHFIFSFYLFLLLSASLVVVWIISTIIEKIERDKLRVCFITLPQYNQSDLVAAFNTAMSTNLDEKAPSKTP